MSIMHYLKYVPTGILGALSLLCFVLSFAGDNINSKALAEMLIFPGAIFLVLAGLSWAMAYFL